MNTVSVEARTRRRHATHYRRAGDQSGSASEAASRPKERRLTSSADLAKNVGGIVLRREVAGVRVIGVDDAGRLSRAAEMNARR